MARYLITKNNVCLECFLNIDEVQNYIMENFEAKLIDRQLCNKNGDRKSIGELIEDNGFDFLSLQTFIEPYGIPENEIINAHIEDGQLVISLISGEQRKIEC